MSVDAVAIRETIMQAHIAIVWDAESENKQSLKPEQKEFAKSFRDRRNRLLRHKYNCSRVLQSHWRLRDTSKKEAVAKAVDAWNEEMHQEGLVSLMYVVELWGIKSEIESWSHLEMTAIAGWLQMMASNLNEAIQNKYFRRATKNKYEQNITFLRDVLSNDFPHDFPRWDEAVRDMEMVDELFNEASQHVASTEAKVRVK